MLNKANKTKIILSGALLVVAATVALAKKPAPPPPPPNVPPGQQVAVNQGQQPNGPRPKVQVVFVVDTTGSMGGLIQGAKDKIWSIANHIMSGNPRPDLEIGLVAYRDQGDDYVTRDYPLRADLDAVYGDLHTFAAGGGGDTPEHVNKGLNDAVHNMKWKDGAMKMIFLVGDAPPHLDYKDGYDYRQIVKDARKQDISVYAIRCGGDPDTERVWKEIASLGKGVYASIAQDGGVAVVATPMDKELADLSRQLDGTTLIYGDAHENARVAAKAEAVAAAPPPAAADRGGYMAKAGSASLDSSDILNEVHAGRLDPANMEREKLPEPMKKMNSEEQKKFLADKEKQRGEILKKMNDVSVKRDEYLRANAGKGKADGFDQVVDKAISEQGNEYHIAF